MVAVIQYANQMVMAMTGRFEGRSSSQGSPTKMSARFLELILMEALQSALQIQQETIKEEKCTTSDSQSIL